MFPIPGKAGESLLIPETRADDQPYFGPHELADASRYLATHGYTVVRGLIPEALCLRSMATFESGVKRYDGYLYRQTTANPELNELTAAGHVINPVLNVQDLATERFLPFRSATLDVLTFAGAQEFLRLHYGEAAKIVQTMYFEGNPATWAHQDTYYLDAEEIGTVVAGWFALEDIRPGAGRFFVYRDSHLVDMRKNGGDFDVAFNHERYKKLVIGIVKERGLQCVAPALARGDVLFWSGKTIHGSLETVDLRSSRSSLTAHYIPESARFLQFQSRVKPLRLRDYNGMAVHHPKALDEASKRAVLKIETTFPRSFRLLKRVAVKAMTRLS